MLVEHDAQNRPQLIGVHDREQPALGLPLGAHAGDVAGEVRTVVDEPFEPALEAGKPVEQLRLERFDGKERNQADHRPDLQRAALAVRQVQDVVEEAVLVVPQRQAVAAAVVHRVGDVEEVLPELAGDVLVGRVVLRELHGDGEQVERIHRHPARAVRLLEVTAGRQRRAAIEHADVVEAQEAALEDVLALGVLAIHPPGEVQEQLVEDALEESRRRRCPRRFFSIL